MVEVVVNFSDLDNALSEDADNVDKLRFWYQKLSEFEPTGSENADKVGILVRGYKWIMQYEHTASEELRELAEHEATEFAEKEESWDNEREALKEEISMLRERMTTTLGVDAMHDTLRAEIDSLKTENSYVKQQNRDRDRELADLRDRNEQISGKIDDMERERSALVSHKSQLEDTIRDLTRRVSSKTDLIGGDWESRKLKQRSDQAVVLSHQLQNAVSQNDSLKAEIDRLSTALTEATEVIRETTDKYGSLKKEFIDAENVIQKLLEDKAHLTDRLKAIETNLQKKEESFCAVNQDVDIIIKNKDTQLEKYRTHIQLLEAQVDDQASRLAALNNDDRESELERLRSELVDATHTAQELFGSFVKASTASDTGEKVDPLAQQRVVILQLEQQLIRLRAQYETLEGECAEAQKAVEARDVINAKVSDQLNRIRKTTFGDAESEVRKLELQISYRDEQIAQLSAKCSLLQNELQQQMKTSVPLVREQPRKLECVGASGSSRTMLLRAIPKSPKNLKNFRSQSEDVKTYPKQQPLVQPVLSPPPLISIQTPQSPSEKRQVNLTEVEASAMIISSLNYQLLNLMKENEAKERQLSDFEHAAERQNQDLQLARAKIGYLVSAYAELEAKVALTTNMTSRSPEAEKTEANMTQLEIKIIELERLADSIGQDAPELQRRIEEVTRKLIYVQIQSSQAQLELRSAKKIQENLKMVNEQLKTKLKRLLIGEGNKLKQLTHDYELTMIELARLQNVLMHSVPMEQYEKVLKTAKRLAYEHGPLDMEYNPESDDAFALNYASLIERTRDNSHQACDQQQCETNKVLSSQNEFLQHEVQRQQLEISELKAFLQDIETQTEIKNLVVNIERRFLQAIQEHSDATFEHTFTEKEVFRLRHALNKHQNVTNSRQKNLVQIIVHLQAALNRLKTQTTSGLRIEHFVEFKTAAEKLKHQQTKLEKLKFEVEEKAAALEMERSLVESRSAAIADVVGADYNVERLQKLLQGYQFNIVTVSGELKQTKTEVRHLNAQLAELEEKVIDLTKENNDLSMLHVYLSKLDKNEDMKEDAAPKDIQPEIIPSISPGPESAFTNTDRSSTDSNSVEDTTPRKVSDEQRPSWPATSQSIVFDNSTIYEREIAQVKEIARLCIETYKAQLRQKEQAIEEYKALISGLQRQLSKSLEAPSPPSGSDEKIRKLMASLDEKIKTTIKKERKILNLESKIKILETKLRHKNTKHSKTKEMSFLVSQPPVQENNDFEEDSENVEEAKPSVKGEVPLQKNEIPSGRSSINGETSGGASSSSNDGNTSDSGTVEDMDEEHIPSLNLQQNESPSLKENTKSRSLSFSDNVLNVKERSENKEHKTTTTTSTQRQTTTAAALTSLVVVGDNRELVIYNQRNEIRRLRERISNFERRIRVVETERDSWKQRNRFCGIKNPELVSATEENSMLTSVKKENERIKRESRNLTRTLENQKRQIEDLQKALSKRAAALQNKETLESWEDKKKRENSITSLRKKLSESQEHETELASLLERRERHLEQLQREAVDRFTENEKLQHLTTLLKTQKTVFEEKELYWKRELELSTGQYRELMHRLEIIVNENRLLKKRLDILKNEQEKAATIRKSAVVPSRSEGTQTPSLIPHSRETATFNVADNFQLLRKELRLSEIKRMELTEKVQSLEQSNVEAQDRLIRALRAEQDRHSDSEKIAAVVLLRDKLAAKDKEIDSQKQKITILERRLFQLENFGDKRQQIS